MEGRDDAIDHISNLPACLRTHILSFLTLKEAVRTCTLSTKWRNEWASVPILSFDSDDFIPNTYASYAEYLEHESKFERIVNGVLRNREASGWLDTFRLVHNNPADGLTDAWDELAEGLLRVVNCRPRVIFIQIRKIYLSPNVGSVFPESVWTRVFNCPSLEKMDLWFDCNYYTFEEICPKSVNLPSLKALELREVKNEVDDCFVKILFTGCPELEDLVLLCCHFNFGFCEIASNKLKKLVIRACTMNEIQISCPSLVSLTINVELQGEVSLKNMPSLVDAKINISFLAQTKQNLLSGLSSATSLSLFFNQSEVKELFADDIFNCKTFNNLESLELENWLPNEGFVDMLACFIHNSPNLQKLTVYLCQSDENDVDEVGVQGSSNVLRQREHLKMVNIIKRYGANDEYVDKLVKIFHAHVKAIEEISVISEVQDIEEEEEKGGWED